MIILEFEGQPLRLLVLRDRPWYAIEDLARALSEPIATVLNQLAPDERVELPIHNSEPPLCWANEWGIYSLLRSLASPTALRLKQWLLDEATLSIHQSQASVSISARNALDLAIPILRELGVDAKQIATWMLEQYRRIYPDHADFFVDIRQTVENQQTILPISKTPLKLDENPAASTIRLSPTELGQTIAKEYGLGFTPSPQKINRALAELNWQISLERGKGKEWQLTKVGNQHGRWEECLDRLSKNRLQIRWSPTVAPIVAQHMGLL